MIAPRRLSRRLEAFAIRFGCVEGPQKAKRYDGNLSVIMYKSPLLMNELDSHLHQPQNQIIGLIPVGGYFFHNDL